MPDFDRLETHTHRRAGICARYPETAGRWHPGPRFLLCLGERGGTYTSRKRKHVPGVPPSGRAVCGMAFRQALQLAACGLAGGSAAVLFSAVAVGKPRGGGDADTRTTEPPAWTEARPGRGVWDSNWDRCGDGRVGLRPASSHPSPFGGFRCPEGNGVY